MTNNKKALPEKDLIMALQGKKKEGYDALYEMYSASLYGVIHRIVCIEEISEDVLQETFIRVWNSFSNFDSQKGTLFTWLLNIARNLAIDKVRSKAYRNESKNQDPEIYVNEIDMVKNSSYNPELMGLKDMVNQLKPDQKIIVELVYLKGYTHVEASEHLEMPLGTVKTRLRAGIIELRKFFNE